MLKQVRKNKARKFISAHDRYWFSISKSLGSRDCKLFDGLKKGNKIVWEPAKESELTMYLRHSSTQVLAAYRKTDKYRSKPLMYSIEITPEDTSSTSD